MEESEVIIVDGIPNSVYDSLIESCVKYAIISLPFTVDRMSIPNEKQRALNIAKGKVAESLFKYFCDQNNINADFDACTTPFWTVDNRDFLLNGNEWDIKNNFIYHSHEILNGYEYINLPGLVPNKNDNDQWNKKEKLLTINSKKTEFLFTFLKNSDLIKGQRGKEFLEIILSKEQLELLTKLYKKYNGMPQENKPYDEEKFWDKMKSLGSSDFYKLYFRPFLIITGYANENHWDLFKDTGPYDRDNNFQTHISPRWYIKVGKGSCNYLDGTFCTRITNATTPICNLPSFLSLFPGLKNKVNCGKIKNKND